MTTACLSLSSTRASPPCTRPAEKPEEAATVHDEVRAIGSLAQAVIDQGIPAVLGMRYSVFVVTAAQYIGELYASLAKGRQLRASRHRGTKTPPPQSRPLGRPPSRGPFRTGASLSCTRPLRSGWLPTDKPLQLGEQPKMDPVQINEALRRYVPDQGFVGRDETLLMLDRGFDDHSVVLLHAYAGQGKTSTAVEFARWYARTGGLGPEPKVLFTSFEHHTDLVDVLDQIGQHFAGDPPGQGHRMVRSQRPRASVKLFSIYFGRSLSSGSGTMWSPSRDSPRARSPRGPLPSRRNWPTSSNRSSWTTRPGPKSSSPPDETNRSGSAGFRTAYRCQRMSSADAAGLALKLAKEKGTSRVPRSRTGSRCSTTARGIPSRFASSSGQAVNMGLRGREQIEQVHPGRARR